MKENEKILVTTLYANNPPPDRKSAKTHRMKYMNTTHPKIMYTKCIQSNCHWCHCSECVSVILFFSSSSFCILLHTFLNPMFLGWCMHSVWLRSFSVAFRFIDLVFGTATFQYIFQRINIHERSFLLTCIRFLFYRHFSKRGKKGFPISHTFTRRIR